MELNGDANVLADEDEIEEEPEVNLDLKDPPKREDVVVVVIVVVVAVEVVLVPPLPLLLPPLRRLAKMSSTVAETASGC